jgi:hypothetical protein
MGESKGLIWNREKEYPIKIGGRCHSEEGARSVLSDCTIGCAPTEESLRWAHDPVGYVGFGASGPARFR